MTIVLLLVADTYYEILWLHSKQWVPDGVDKRLQSNVFLALLKYTWVHDKI